MSVRINPYFTLEEFASPDTPEIPQDVRMNLYDLADHLMVLRCTLGRPININSGYRTPEHNIAVGGEPRSYHLIGKAADIRVNGISPDEVADTIEHLIEVGAIPEGGVGRYATFTHYDYRGKRARWNG